MDDIGDLHPITAEVRDENGALVNANTVALTVTRPDGTTDTPSVSNPPIQTGIYLHDWPNVAGGWHQWVMTTTVPSTSTRGSWHVHSGLPGLISLDEAKDHLNKNQQTYTDDEELRDFIDCASEWVEAQVGRQRRQTIATRYYPNAAGVIYLGGPALSIVSIEAVAGNSGVYTVSDYDLDSEDGRLSSKTGGPRLCDPVKITWVAGRVSFSALVRSATKDYLLWDWRSQRGSTPLPLAEAELFAQEPGTIPYKIREKLRVKHEPVWA